MLNTSVELLQRWRFLTLLLALLALLVVQPIASAFGLMTSLFNVLVVVVMVALIFALAADRPWRLVAGALCLVVASLSFGGIFLPSAARAVSLTAGHAIGALFFAVVAGKIVHSVFTARKLKLDSVFGALCGYLLLGLAWALTYAMIYAAQPESFEMGAAAARQMNDAGDGRHFFIYYSFITLTTVGYGDVTPLSVSARTLSWFEAMTGQLYLTVLIAGLVSALVAARGQPVRSDPAKAAPASV